MGNINGDTAPSTKKQVKRRKIKWRESTVWDVVIFLVFYCWIIGAVFGGTYRELMQDTASTIWSNTLAVTGQGEMSVRHLGGQLNTMYCQSYNVSSLTSRDVYLTSGTAKVTKQPTQSITRNGSQVYPFTYNSGNWFYLLEGSNIRISACRTNHSADQTKEHVDLLIFKGLDNFYNWQNQPWKELYERNTTVPLDAFCDEDHQAVLSYDVKERDTYIAAVVDIDLFYNNMNVEAELIVSQTTFEGTKKMCTRSSECNVPVDYNSDVDIVVGETDSTFSGKQQVWVTCFMRMPFWIGIFIIFPAILVVVGVVTTILVFLNQQKKKRARKQKQSEDCERVNNKGRDNAGLVINEVPPSSS